MGNQEKKLKCPQCLSPISEESRYCHKCGFLLEEEQKTLTYTPPMEELADDKLYFLPGDSFGPRYRIIEEIGRGGMGRVYKAEDKELAIIVALKMIRPEYSTNPRFIQQFKKEILLARSISHENVTRIHDLGEVEEIKFISMDYIRGQNLKELIQTSGALAVDTTINITRQICGALKAAHQKGIVHLDLKPRNIMIDNEGQVYVMDFGVAKSIAAQEEGPARGIIGTAPYISPEQAKGEKTDQRSDIYSFGIIIFEMLTGKRPFEANTESGYIEKHLHERPPLPSKFNPGIPPYLERIILKCLEKNRDKRYQNVEEIFKDLEEHKEESRIIFAQPRAKMLLKYAYIIPLILLVAFVVYLLIGKRKPVPSVLSAEKRIPLAVMFFENNTGDESFDNWRIALADYLSSDLAQSRHLHVLPTDRLLHLLKTMKQEETKQYSSDILDGIASQEDIEYFILGSYTKAEDNFWINLKIRKSHTQELVDTLIEEGTGEASLLPMLDSLTPEIKTKLGIPHDEIVADFDRDVGKIVTSSPEAHEYYLLGKQCYHEGEFQKSIDLLEKAVELDPEFAEAYRRISENYHYLGYIDKATEYIQKALSLLKLDRVSVREHYLIQGFAYTLLEDSYTKAMETYETLLKYYPDDENGNIYLGAIYRNLEEWDLAKERFEKILRINPEIACENLVYIYTAKGAYDKAKEILQTNQHFFKRFIFYRKISQIYLCQGNCDRALLEIENALSLESDDFIALRLMGNINQIQGHFQEAAYIYQQLSEKNEPHFRLRGQLWHGHLYLNQGKYKKSKNKVLQGIKESMEFGLKPTKLQFLLFLCYLNLQTNQYSEAFKVAVQAKELASDIGFEEGEFLALHLKGLIHLKMKELNKAKNTAEELKQLIEKTGKEKFMRHYHHLRGSIAQEEGLIVRAIDDLKKGFSLLPQQKGTDDKHAFFLYSLAKVYYQSGDLEKASRHFERLVLLSTGRLQWEDLYVKSFYWLGKTYQRKGWIGKAIENYEKFLQLWKDADPDLPELADANYQLTNLKASPQE